MFTGIIQNTGTIRSITRQGDWRVEIGTALDLNALAIGASVACAGCCLTVTEKGVDWFAAQVSQETLSKTTIKDWQAGMRVNLEPSLRLGDELGGHFVFGHIDGLAEIVEVKLQGESHLMVMRAPLDLMRFIAPKGSVALDGISLTVNSVEKDMFTVNIVPHTWAQTTLGQAQKGARLNLEIDMLARYVAKMQEAA